MDMKRGMSFYIIIGVAVLLGLVVAAFFAGLANTEQVVVAARPLPVGARIYPDDIETKEIHASAVLEGAFTDPEEVMGQLLNVPRTPGEQIARAMVGSRAINAIAATLEPDWRAVGVELSKAQGVAGVLRPGDAVDVVGILDTSTLMQSFGLRNPTDEEEEEFSDPGVLSRVVLKDAKVALVPQSFRYEELPETGEEGMSLVQASAAASGEGTIVLAVPATPITFTLSLTDTAEAEDTTSSSGVVGLLAETEAITPTVVSISPVELLALLDSQGEIYLALSPEEKMDVDTPGLAMRDLVLWLTPKNSQSANQQISEGMNSYEERK
jgi:Flp pilus assembly protein CpaB